VTIVSDHVLDAADAVLGGLQRAEADGTVPSPHPSTSASSTRTRRARITSAGWASGSCAAFCGEDYKPAERRRLRPTVFGMAIRPIVGGGAASHNAVRRSPADRATLVACAPVCPDRASAVKLPPRLAASIREHTSAVKPDVVDERLRRLPSVLRHYRRHRWLSRSQPNRSRSSSSTSTSATPNERRCAPSNQPEPP
jgi:hypothetical protein